MPTALAHFIQTTPLCDTHEHLRSEQGYVEDGPDLLRHLFGNYIPADLVVAGAAQAAVDRLLDGSDPDIRARFAGVEKAWQAVRHTGYGEAVRIIARELYGIDELSGASLEAALPCTLRCVNRASDCISCASGPIWTTYRPTTLYAPVPSIPLAQTFSSTIFPGSVFPAANRM